jgi:hypothetical protein
VRRHLEILYNRPGVNVFRLAPPSTGEPVSFRKETPVLASLRNPSLRIVLPLAALLAMTRYHYFATIPDATLAVFLLAGFYLRSPWWLGLFLAEAAVVDYVAIAFAGVSNWCVTPAYALLIPAYAVPWLGGRLYRRLHRWDWRTLLPLGGVVLASVTAAFLISDGSFYLLSGYFTDLSWSSYTSHFAKYYPYYLLGTSVYVALAALLHVGMRAVRPFAADARAEGVRPR